MTARATSGGRRQEVAGVNPQVLRWARERAGWTVAGVAEKLDKDAATIEAWESGTAAPTYSELERLAYQVLKRPVAVFFFAAPPAEEGPRESFRTLPEFEIDKLTPATRHVIRSARADQIALAELFGGTAPSPDPILRAVRIGPRDTSASAARAARTALGITMAHQLAWRTAEQALAAWRDALEAAGVFVFKTSIRQHSVSGFCLYHATYPIIVLNNSTSFTRQTFTLAHELGHLLSHTGGVTVTDDEYVDTLSDEPRAIEIFCNRFAADLLVPPDDFQRRSHGVRPDDRSVAHLADTYKVSREVVLRRFLDLGAVSRTVYERKAEAWTTDFERSRDEDAAGGGDWYRTRAAYLSPRMLREVMGRYLKGAIDAVEAATLLGVKPAHVAGLEDLVLRKVGA